MEPKVTVVVLTYNLRQYVSGALDSILQQKTDFPFRIRIVDDCSTDGTRDILLDYKEKYPETIELMFALENGGCNVNAIRAFDGIPGEYIALLDGDDEWVGAHRLQHQVDFLDSHPEYALCSGQTQLIVDGRPGNVMLQSRWLGATYTFHDYFQTPMLFHTSGLLLRNVVFRHGMPHCYYASVGTYLDCALRGEEFRRAEHLEQGDLFVLPEIVSRYRIHNKGLWSGMSEARQAIETAISTMFLADYFAPRHPEMRQLMEAYAEWRYREMWEILINKKYIYPVNRLNEKEMYLFTEYMKNKSMRERKNNKFKFEIV